MKKTSSLFIGLTSILLLGCGGGGGSSVSNNTPNNESLTQPALQFAENTVNIFYQKKSFSIPQEDVLYSKSDISYNAPNAPEYQLNSVLPLMSFDDDLINKKYTNLSLDHVVYYSQGKLMLADTKTLTAKSFGAPLNITQASTFCGFWESAFQKEISTQHYFIYSVAQNGFTCNTNNAGAAFYLASTGDSETQVSKQIERPLAMLPNGWLIGKSQTLASKTDIYRCNLDCSSETLIDTIDGINPRPIAKEDISLLKNSHALFTSDGVIFAFNAETNSLNSLGAWNSYSSNTLANSDDQYLYITQSLAGGQSAVVMIEKANLNNKTALYVKDFTYQGGSLPSDVTKDQAVTFHELRITKNYIFVLYSYATSDEKHVAHIYKTNKEGTIRMSSTDVEFIGSEFSTDYIRINSKSLSDNIYHGICYRGAYHESCYNGAYISLSFDAITDSNYAPIFYFSHIEATTPNQLNLYTDALCTITDPFSICTNKLVGTMPFNQNSTLYPLLSVGGSTGAVVLDGALYSFDYKQTNSLKYISLN